MNFTESNAVKQFTLDVIMNSVRFFTFASSDALAVANNVEEGRC